VEFFRQNYGPTTRAFTTLGAADQANLRKELVELWTSHNKAGGPARTIVDSEYLEVVAVTRTADELKEVPNDSVRDLSK
jgi:hypothetical protein